MKRFLVECRSNFELRWICTVSQQQRQAERLVISLSRPISHTVEVKAKNLTCSECPRYNERGICACALVVAHRLGKLQEYTNPIRCLSLLWVASNIPNGVGKKENEKKSRKRMSNSPRVVANYGNRVEAETLIKNQRVYLFMK